MNYAMAVLLMVLVAFPGRVLGVDCGEKSQNFLSGGEEYFSSRNLVDSNPRTRSVVDGLYEKISGDWIGSEVFTECRGSLRAMEPVSQRYDVESMVVRGDYGAIKLQKISRRDEGNLSEMLDLFNFKNAVYFQRRGSKIFVIEKFYRLNSSRAQILVENLVTLDLEGGRLDVTVKSYSNGTFSYLQEINLVR